jgi:hypothetical protein
MKRLYTCGFLQERFYHNNGTLSLPHSPCHYVCVFVYRRTHRFLFFDDRTVTRTLVFRFKLTVADRKSSDMSGVEVKRERILHQCS